MKSSMGNSVLEAYNRGCANGRMYWDRNSSIEEVLQKWKEEMSLTAIDVLRFKHEVPIFEDLVEAIGFMNEIIDKMFTDMETIKRDNRNIDEL